MLKKLLALLLVVLALFSIASCGGVVNQLLGRDAEDEAVARAEAYDEAEAREWVLDVITEEMRALWEASDIKSVSARTWADQCYLGASEALNPRAGDADFWRVSKANELDPSYESHLTPSEDAAIDKFALECSVELLTAEELSRSRLLDLF
jgi:hypothetical protein